MKRFRIFYVRHGQTDWNAELRYQGRMDIPLNAKGLHQARENGAKLARILDAGNDVRFLASPLIRTRQTMELLLAALDRDVDAYRIEPTLIEASYGDLEGTTLAEFKASDPETFRRRKAERWAFCPPGGESHEMVAARIDPWLDTLSGDYVVAGHGVVGRVIRQRMLDLPLNEAAEFAFPQDSVFIWSRGDEKRI